MKLAALVLTIFFSINLIAQKYGSTPVQFGKENKGDIRSSYRVAPLGKYENDFLYHTTQLFRIDESSNINHVGTDKEFPLSKIVYRYKDFLYSTGRDKSSFFVKKVNMGEDIVNEISIPLVESDHRIFKTLQSEDGKTLYFATIEKKDETKMLTLISVNIAEDLKYTYKTSKLNLGKSSGVKVSNLILKDDKLFCLLNINHLVVMNLEGKIQTTSKFSLEKINLLQSTISLNPTSGEFNITGLFHIKEMDNVTFNGFYFAKIDSEDYSMKDIKFKPLDKEILSYLDEKFVKRGKTTIYGSYIPSIVQLKGGSYYAIFEHIKSAERKLDELIVYYVDEEGEIQNQNIIPKSQSGTHESYFRHPVQQFFCYTENNALNIIHNGNIEELEVTTSDKVYSYLLPSAAFHIKIKPTGEMTKRVLFDYKKGTDKFYLKPKSIYLDKSSMTAVGAFTDKKKKAKMGRFSLSNF